MIHNSYVALNDELVGSNLLIDQKVTLAYGNTLTFMFRDLVV